MTSVLPDVWFCALCGEVVFSFGVPSRCPACGAHPDLLQVAGGATPVLGRDVTFTAEQHQGGLLALQQETDTAELYSRVAVAAEQARLREAFRALARIEARHAGLLAVLFRSRKPAPLFKPDLAGLSDQDLLAMVRQREDSTIALYAQQVGLAGGSALVQVYEALIAVEADHNLLIDGLEASVAG